MSDLTAPIHEDTDLAANLSAQFGELAGELVSEERVRVEVSAEQSLELLVVIGLEALGIAVDLDG